MLVSQLKQHCGQPMEKLVDLIFPRKCVFCGRYFKMICVECLRMCRVNFDENCIVCDLPSTNGNTHKTCFKELLPTNLFCCFEHVGYVEKCIKMSKYSFKEFAVLKELSEEGMIIALSVNQANEYKNFVVVPIPLNKKRMRSRGFNQSEIIGNILSREFELKMNTKLLKRVKNTITQTGINREERAKNVDKAFIADVLVKGLNVLLIDDVCTTGATLIEASKALYEAGALEVKCFALAKTPKTS